MSPARPARGSGRGRGRGHAAPDPVLAPTLAPPPQPLLDPCRPTLPTSGFIIQPHIVPKLRDGKTWELRSFPCNCRAAGETVAMLVGGSRNAAGEKIWSCAATGVWAQCVRVSLSTIQDHYPECRVTVDELNSLCQKGPTAKPVSQWYAWQFQARSIQILDVRWYVVSKGERVFTQSVQWRWVCVLLCR